MSSSVDRNCGSWTEISKNHNSHTLGVSGPYGHFKRPIGDNWLSLRLSQSHKGSYNTINVDLNAAISFVNCHSLDHLVVDLSFFLPNLRG